jgi:hypothetical protein
MSDWNASNYRARKAQRLARTKPEWIINSDTGEQFYLRKVGGMMSTILAGSLPKSLTNVALEAWKEKGVVGMEKMDDLDEIASRLTPDQVSEGQREMIELSRIVQQSCVIPFLSNEDPEKMKFSDEWKSVAIKGLKEKDPHFNEKKFDPKEYVLNPRELDDLDSTFLLRWAAGAAGTTNLRGGGVTNLSDVERFRKKPGRRIRAGADSAKLQQSA